jgi:hypothetical protein
MQVFVVFVFIGIAARDFYDGIYFSGRSVTGGQGKIIDHCIC